VLRHLRILKFRVYFERSDSLIRPASKMEAFHDIEPAEANEVVTDKKDL
jgi:hypothetical protein